MFLLFLCLLLLLLLLYAQRIVELLNELRTMFKVV